MFLDKVEPFWTEEEEARCNELIDAQGQLIQEAGKKEVADGAITDQAWTERWRAFSDELDEIENQVVRRYYDSFKSEEDIYSDMEEVASALEKKDYLNNVNFWKGTFSQNAESIRSGP